MQIEQNYPRSNDYSGNPGGFSRQSATGSLIQSKVQSSLATLVNSTRELAKIFGSPDVRVVRENGRHRLIVENHNSQPVSLLDMFDENLSPARCMAILGLDNRDHPVQIDLLAEESARILIVGSENAGKSTLIRSSLASLLLASRQADVQLVMIQSGAGAVDLARNLSVLQPLGNAPHAIFPVIESLEGAEEALSICVDELRYRREKRIATPMIVVAIDDVDELIRAGGESLRAKIGILLKDGPRHGFRMILSASNIVDPRLRQLLDPLSLLRLVGRCAGRNEARAASGIPASRAELLQGYGHFMAVVHNKQQLAFQAAYIDDYDLYLLLEVLNHQNQKVLLAQPDESRSQQLYASRNGSHPLVIELLVDSSDKRETSSV